ncbi:MAG: hypothetical protein P8Y93_00770 [Acidobacteriota bacterium]
MRVQVPGRAIYTNTHLQYVAELIERIYAMREQVRGLRIVYEPPVLRHFTARFELLGD